MAAFGDSVLFLWILGLLSVSATVAALYVLRPGRPFWGFTAVTAVMASAVAIGDLLGVLVHFRSATDSPLGVWTMLAPIRVLLAPPLAVGLLLAAVFAPGVRYRYTLVGATVVQAVTFVSVFFIWFSGGA
jgi:hypothetical protein